jgi:hypothetical protein
MILDMGPTFHVIPDLHPTQNWGKLVIVHNGAAERPLKHLQDLLSKVFSQVLRIHEILVRIRIRGSIPRLMDPDPRIRILLFPTEIFKTSNKNYFFF